MPRVIIDSRINLDKNPNEVEYNAEPVQPVQSVQSVQPLQPAPESIQSTGAQEESDSYAHMFADWDLVPPQMVVRRIHRK